MATKLGDVWMTFRLDTAQAQKDLDKLEPGPGKGAASTPQRPKTEKEKEKGITTDVIGKTRSETQKENYFRQLGSAVLKTAGRPLQGGLAAQTALGLTGQVAPFLPPVVGEAIMTAGKVAVAYGIVSETAKIMPQAFVLGRDIAGVKGPDARLDGMEAALDGVRATVVALEAKIVGIISGLSGAIEHSNAVQRLTGQLPNTDFYRRQYQDMAEADTELNAAFDNWKSKEAPLNTVRTFIDIFIRNLTR